MRHREHLEPQVAGRSVLLARVLVGVVLERDLKAVGRALVDLDVEREVRELDLAAAAHRTRAVHDLALAVALVAHGLELLDEARTDTARGRLDAMAAAGRTRVDVVVVRGACAVAVRTHSLTPCGEL